MKVEEKKKYDDNLLKYSSILRGLSYSEQEIRECIKIFEYFEDYEKCKDLIKFIEVSEQKNKIK
jgi:Na+/phosphate symporter